jgi:hypothetical protein
VTATNEKVGRPYSIPVLYNNGGTGLQRSGPAYAYLRGSYTTFTNFGTAVHFGAY